MTLIPKSAPLKACHDPLPENIFPRRDGDTACLSTSKEGGGLNDWNDWNVWNALKD